MEEDDYKEKYNRYKLVVKCWENDFKKKYKRVPSKYDIKDAPMKVKQAYKLYYKMKTSFLESTFTECFDEDDEAANFSHSSIASTSIQQLMASESFSSLPDSSFSNVSSIMQSGKFPETEQIIIEKGPVKVFEAALESTVNDDAWGKDLNKKVLPKKSLPTTEKVLSKIKLNVSSTDQKPFLRNPRKSLSRNLSKLDHKSSNELSQREVLPDLETILLEKSRTNHTVPKPIAPSTIVHHVDINWLERNTESDVSKVIPIVPSVLTSSSGSFGLSNLNIQSSSFIGSENKYHTLDEATDNEVIGNSDEESIPTTVHLHIAKKRKISDVTEPTILRIEPIAPVIPKIMSVPSANQRKSSRKHNKSNNGSNNSDFDCDDSDKDPDFVEEKNDKVKPLAIKIPKVKKPNQTKPARKVIKHLTKTKEAIKRNVNTDNYSSDEKDLLESVQNIREYDSFLIDSDLNNIKSVPRISLKDIEKNDKIFSNYVTSMPSTKPMTTPNSIVRDVKTDMNKNKLEKRVSAGTLNENFVRVNLKKKIFVRGKKSFNFSSYKKKVWKGQKAAKALCGPDMDMGGCDGGVLRCFQCGEVGHFAQNCKVKSDSLLPIDAEQVTQSEYPTLEEAAEAAAHKQLMVHSQYPEKLPVSKNEIWKNVEGEDNQHLNNQNENENENIVLSSAALPTKSYIGHSIPEDFLIKSGLLDHNVANKDEIQPLYELNADGSVITTPPEVFEALKMFGHQKFRNGQEQAVMRILSGCSTLVTLSTGSGKSLCYQLPAYLYRKKRHCVTLCISPLVSLMEDQVVGVPNILNAQCLHTNQTPKQREKTMEDIRSGKVEILLVSPEAVVSGEKSTGFGSLLRQLPPIAFACIDEAHCVSQWSHNFRPSYLMICRVLREKLGVKTVLGLTATATLQTRESIVRHLSIPDGMNGIISDIPLPENLVLTVSKDADKDRALIELLKGSRFSGLQSFIIYCTRRDECERIAGYIRTCLQDNKREETGIANNKRKRINWNAEAYHAGLAASRRRTIQNAFMAGELRIVVATIAFGMGINKSDIRAIIHYNMPKSFESYVQEVGRAGRDGKPAHCHVFLDSKGNDLCELRRHIYANSTDRHVFRKLLEKVFIPCACAQDIAKINLQKDLEAVQNICWSNEMEEDFKDVEIDQHQQLPTPVVRRCPGHEVCFSIENTVELLDIPQENISTLLCYLELHEQRYIQVLGNAYTTCKVMSYGGLKYLKQAAKMCPPLAMAIALNLKKNKGDEDSTTIEFNVVEVAAAIGWDSGVCKYQLKQLEWTTASGMNRRSSISVSFSNLGFRIRAPGDLSDDELDMSLDLLHQRCASQEKTQLIQLQCIFDALAGVGFKSHQPCALEDCPQDPSNKLKSIIREYFQSNLPTQVELWQEIDDTSDQEIIADIRVMISSYPENNFTGRSLARIFHGVASPNFPPVIWGRCKYWRAHTKVDFNRVVTIANLEIVRMRS